MRLGLQSDITVYPLSMIASKNKLKATQNTGGTAIFIYWWWEYNII